MLADGARLGADGKLYIFGGQWDRIFAPSMPTTHPTMTVVLVLEIEYGEALEEHTVGIALLDADGRPLGPRSVANVRTGHPPFQDRGTPLSLPMAVDFTNVEFPSYGRYEWAIEVDGEGVERLPISVAPLGFPGAVAGRRSDGMPQPGPDPDA
jgi:hypothetical protein